MTVTAAKPALDDLPELNSEPVTESQNTADVFSSMLEELRAAQSKAEQLPGYTATWEQQVEIDGVLRDTEFVDAKVRQRPFSVYMKWHEDGQEALYVDGANSNRILVRPTRGLIALRGIWRLRPDSPQALRDTRYPITEFGVAKLAEQALAFHKARNYSQQGMHCRFDEFDNEGVPCRRYTVTFDAPEDAEYATSILTFDLDQGLLIAMENHSWGPDARPGQLLERYVYHNLTPASDLTDNDFSEKNPAYAFKK